MYNCYVCGKDLGNKDFKNNSDIHTGERLTCSYECAEVYKANKSFLESEEYKMAFIKGQYAL